LINSLRRVGGLVYSDSPFNQKTKTLTDESNIQTLKNAKIYRKDFSFFFEKFNSKKNFMLLDPPYYGTMGYNNIFTKEDHIRLFNYFKKTKIRCLLLINKCDFICDLYKAYIVDEYNKDYFVKNIVGKKSDDKILIIKNFK